MSVFSVENKTILITGASSGIGAETARLLAENGATLVLSGRNKEKLNEVLQQLPTQEHQVISADLTHEEELEALVAQCPNLDGIVHSAGIVRPFPVKFIGHKQINQLFSINYSGPTVLTGRLFRTKKINAGASIVFMSSISSKFPHKGGALYSGTKAALNSFSKTIALEYASQRIRSNVISAAMVKTPLFDEAQKAISKEMMDKHGEQYPLGFGTPEDISNTMLFLLSDASRWITGTEIVMDGGLTAGQ